MSEPLLVVYLYMEDCDGRRDGHKAALIGTFDRAKAEQYVVDLIAKDELAQERIELLNQFDTDYTAAHEYSYNGPELRERVRWASGLKQEEITDAMRQERKEISDYNNAIIAEKTRLHAVWRQAFDDAKDVYMASLGIPAEKFDKYRQWSYFDERRYEIEELKMI